jgi:hypothetical protein
MTRIEQNVLRDLARTSRADYAEADQSSPAESARALVVRFLRRQILSQPTRSLPPTLGPGSAPRPGSELRGARAVAVPRLLRFLGRAAAEAETDDEAEAFAGAMIPVATRCVPGAEDILYFLLPVLVSGLVGSVLFLRHYPGMGYLVRSLPAILQRTVDGILRWHLAGRAISPRRALRLFSRQLGRTMGAPRPVVSVAGRVRIPPGPFRRAPAWGPRLGRGRPARPAYSIPRPRVRMPAVRRPRVSMPRTGRSFAFRRR